MRSQLEELLKKTAYFTGGSYNGNSLILGGEEFDEIYTFPNVVIIDEFVSKSALKSQASANDLVLFNKKHHLRQENNFKRHPNNIKGFDKESYVRLSPAELYALHNTADLRIPVVLTSFTPTIAYFSIEQQNDTKQQKDLFDKPSGVIKAYTFHQPEGRDSPVAKPIKLMEVRVTSSQGIDCLEVKYKHFCSQVPFEKYYERKIFLRGVKRDLGEFPAYRIVPDEQNPNSLLIL